MRNKTLQQKSAVALAVLASTGIHTNNPYAGAPSLKEGGSPDSVEELKQIIVDNQKAAVEARDKIAKQQGEIDGFVKKLQTELDGQKTANVETRDEFQKSVAKVEQIEKDLGAALQKMDALKSVQSEDHIGFAQMAAESEAAKSYSGGHATLASYEGPAFRKDILGDVAANALDLVVEQRMPGIVAGPERPLTIRDLLTVVSTTSSSIEWARETTYTNNAAPQGGEGAAKAKSDLRFEKQNSPVQTLAHWFAASRQILADAPSLRSYIEQRGTYGLKLKEEDQLLTGDGTGNNLAGILPAATAYNVALNETGDTKVDQIRRAILQSSLSLYPADSVVMDLADWAAIETTKTTDGAYVFASPVNGATPRLWGKRVVSSLAMPANTFLSASFAMGATLWDRELVTVRVSESHADFFIENMVAILIEERLALTLERPAAFVSGTFT